MPVSRSLRRLLRIRDLEEEHLRLAMETSIAQLQSLQNALATAQLRGRKGKELLALGTRSGEIADRQAGLVETYAAERRAQALIPHIEEAEANTLRLRQSYLAKRVERRQAETLIEEAEARDAVEAGRKSQGALDEWYRSRQYRNSLENNSDEKASSKENQNNRPVAPEL